MPKARKPSKEQLSDASVEDMLATRLSVSSVSVSGAERTSQALLDRITLPVLSTGGTFSSVVEDVSKVVDLLRSTNCYRGVDAFLDTSSDSSASVQFTLAEKKFYQIQTGASIDTSPGAPHDPSLEASFVWNNLSGHADSLKAAVSWMGGSAGTAFAARPTSRAQFDYHRPFAFHLNAGLSASLSSSMHNHEENSSHSLLLRSGQVGIDHPFGRLSLLAAWRHVLDVDDKASPLVHNNAGHSWKTSVQQAIEIDRRDSRRMPSTGDLISLTGEATLPVGDVRFAKLDSSYQLHFPVGSSGIIASISSRFGILLSPNQTSIIDRFYLGGPVSFRGFQSRGVGPRDQSDAVGGDVFYTIGGMISIPMPESSLLAQLFNARLHVFSTVGDLTDVASAQSVLSSLSKKGSLKNRVSSAWGSVYESMRITSGLGVALETTIGRIELNYCRVLRSANSDIATGGFQFGISEGFS